ncbi:sensor histidine kinase [Heyndrickxia oleronia]|uniref:sensor histidine kinase n=1 Tax=Heyndrickxia oleronia TaxID=38875 RepID=UPI00375390F6
MNYTKLKRMAKRKLLSLPYRSKLILVFSLLILLTATILGSITYYQFAKSSQLRTKEYQLQLADQMNRNLNRYIKEMQIISLSPLYDQDVLNTLKNHQVMKEGASLPPASERVKIWRYISSLIHMRDEIKGIHILANDGTVFSNLDSNTVLLKVFDNKSEWIKEIRQADGGWIILPLHQPNYYINRKENVFSVARLIRDPATQKSLGIIKIDLKQELFKEILSNTQANSFIYIVDKHNRSIYPNNTRKMISDSLLLQIDKGKRDNYTKTIMDGQSYMMVANTSSYSGIKVIMLTPRSEIFSEVNHLQKVLVLVVLLGMIISSLLGVILSKPLVGSIHKLRTSMREVEKGNLSQRVQIESGDEIGELGKGFNHMVNEIDRLVTEVYKTNLREKEAEIRALQSQLNPHFLYNTLESINMLAITQGSLDVSDMVSSLGKLMRYTIDHSSKLVTLGEEISFIHSYVMIQKVRIGEKLQYREEIDPSLLDISIPKLILQPLVENAIIHGISAQGGTIFIRGYRKEQKLYLIVSDNGQGVSSKKLKDLYESINSPVPIASKKYHGIALPNIHERIQLLYGRQYGIEIQSEVNKGFTIQVVLPLINEGGKEVERSTSH